MEEDYKLVPVNEKVLLKVIEHFNSNLQFYGYEEQTDYGAPTLERKFEKNTDTVKYISQCMFQMYSDLASCFEVDEKGDWYQLPEL